MYLPAEKNIRSRRTNPVTVTDLDIRRYEPADATQVWTVHENALRDSPLTFVEDAPADRDITEISREYLDGGGDFLVGSLADDIVAMGGFQRRDEYTAELRRMRVHPAYQNRGYGEQLLEALEERARQRGITRITLHTNGQLTAARKLYQKHGYEKTASETDPEHGETFVYYRKQL